MNISFAQIRNHRLQVHHLDQKLPADAILCAAGACGLQNSPPGAWETALFMELLDRTLADIIMRDLPEEKRPLWCAPSIYGNPDKQTMGGAAVSFLLRPLNPRMQTKFLHANSCIAMARPP